MKPIVCIMPEIGDTVCFSDGVHGKINSISYYKYKPYADNSVSQCSKKAKYCGQIEFRLNISSEEKISPTQTYLVIENASMNTKLKVKSMHQAAGSVYMTCVAHVFAINKTIEPTKIKTSPQDSAKIFGINEDELSRFDFFDLE